MKPIIHMIGQAHLDPVWLWRWPEGRAEAVATTASALDRLDEYPDFQFTRGEAQVYAWVRAEAPQLFDRIRAAIAAGRWHVVNGMVIQPDMNIPSGESFVRQSLLGKAWMAKHLGVEPTVAYCVDSFGHAGTLPQILAKCGFTSYVFMRPQAHEKQLPASAFWWQGPDGSRILAFRISDAYTTRTPDHRGHIAAALAEKSEALGETMCFFGVGNHGGGPTKLQIEDIQRLADTDDALDIRFSSPPAFFQAIDAATAALPTVAEELQFHAVGCYAVVSDLKRGHRLAEQKLLLAERLTTLAAQMGAVPAPTTALSQLWWSLCFNQFHDTLGGSSLRSAERDAVRAFDAIIAGCDELIDDAGRLLSAQIDSAGPGGSVVLFNPHPEPLSVVVEYEPWTDWQPWDEGGWDLRDEAGAPVGYQLLEPDAAIGWGGIAHLAFRAELPPLGYRLYRFAPGLRASVLPTTPKRDRFGRSRGAGTASDADAAWLTVSPTTLANERLALRLDSVSGAIVSCVLDGGPELVGPDGWNVAQTIADHSDTWSHDVRRFDAPAEPWRVVRCGVAERGPLHASLLIERRWEGAVWTQYLQLNAGDAHITVRNRLSWQGEWKVVKLAFDVAAELPESRHDVPFGAVQRPVDGMEVPTQQWMALFGAAGGGLAVINDGKYSCDALDSTMRLTILRAVPYAYHVPHQIGAKKRYDWVDQGEQEFTLVLRPFNGLWEAAGITQLARALHLPPVAITSYGHPGALPSQGSLGRLDASELELTALKIAEDGDGVIVRLADRHGLGGAGVFIWHGRRFDVACAPFEVNTYRLRQNNGLWDMVTCDMIEQLTIDN